MLPGRRWRRAGPAVPLRALFGYRYRAEDGREVAMAAGERLLLLRRATPDWWQVRRPGDPPWARPFFVPATYVAEEEPGDSGTRSPRTPGQPAWGGGSAARRRTCVPPPRPPPRAVGTGTGQLAGGVIPTPAQCQSQQDTGGRPLSAEPPRTTAGQSPGGVGQVTHDGSLAHHSPEDWGADLAQAAAPQEQRGFMGGCPGLNPDSTEQQEGPPGSADHKQAFFVSTKPVNRCPLK
ncbi:rho GTPase-activating protein 9-like [Chiroxiphia lanceolata]|uniref:rho GTPase-activating protein 9-like n=1 Tax=Chiroxiphia lanceolata TaxID=296741 RepID=UPI0013CE965F|nr:rho GTPase-activating protein 9-like [Chiroxiphia lanceolata]